MSNVPFERAANLGGAFGIRHGFFGRRGAGQELNVSENFGTGDAVRENRRRAVIALGGGDVPLIGLRQVHSNEVVTLTELPAGDTRPEADGLVTALPGVALGINTADCAPILFADPEAGVIGACHAGWRGAVGGIAGKTLDAMIALGAARDRIAAAIGPTISGPNYETGPEFAETLLRRDPATAPFIFVPDGGAREHFDLPGYLTAQLGTLGLASIERTGGCTYSDPSRYFSHRHSTHHGTPEGRQIAIVLHS